MRTSTRHDRIARGDWQTPEELAASVTEFAARRAFESPATIVEPTCGSGAFLRAAASRFPRARLVGFEIDPTHARRARAAAPQGRAVVRVADAFALDWERALGSLPEPILVLGNPPWVTSARLGTLSSEGGPPRANQGLRGIDALTGRSNFDVSEWIVLRLVRALASRRAAVALLLKSQVARRVIERCAAALQPGALVRIDAGRWFGAAVDAVLFVARVAAAAEDPATLAEARWPVYDALAGALSDVTGAARPSRAIAVMSGRVVADAKRWARTRHLMGEACPEWRSGVKHDCARVMELVFERGAWRNGFGDVVQVEGDVLYPLLKSSDVAHGRTAPTRALIVPQRRLGEDTARLRVDAPKAWSYLVRHGALLDARKSSIYARGPRFALFGLGDYSFAPWKVAVSGLHKRCAFALVGPHEGRPVVLDDTCYFMPFGAEAPAARALAALRSREAADFFAARVFWDAKRPVSKAVLQSLDLRRILPVPADAPSR